MFLHRGAMRPAWKAELALVFRHLDHRTFVAERRHEGPLVVQKALYPEGLGVCHSVLVHARAESPAGIPWRWTSSWKRVQGR